jgi:histidinol-phosphate/aromatic aminotransferase/cobyric acid decarboxylase-like protein
VVVNPDNPSGHLLDKAEAEALVEGTRKLGAKLVVDESFVDFAVEGRAFTLLGEDYLRANPHLFVVKSVSKSYGVPGFRLGVLATGDETTAAAIRKALPVWNINSFGEFFLQIVDKYKADYRRACAQLRRNGPLRGALAATGWCRSTRPRRTTCSAGSWGRRPRCPGQRLLTGTAS